MSSKLDKFGVAEGELSSHTNQGNYIDVVPNRVVHIDADLIVYTVACESKDELDPCVTDTPRRDLKSMLKQVDDIIETTRKQAGAARSVLHSTAVGSTKLNRPQVVVQAEYQAHRSEKDKPENFSAVKRYVESLENCIVHTHQEADDGLVQASYASKDKPHLCVVASQDKDMRMCNGWLMLRNGDGTVDFSYSVGFGHTRIDDSKSTKKIVGRGDKFFWSQVLTGDTADNIKGLPFITGTSLTTLKPTKAYSKAIQEKQALANKLREYPENVEILGMLENAEKIILAEENKKKRVGPVIADELLKDCKTNAECYHLVSCLFEEAHNAEAFVHWKTEEPVSFKEALFGDMYALWITRTNKKYDLAEWLTEQGVKYNE